MSNLTPEFFKVPKTANEILIAVIDAVHPQDGSCPSDKLAMDDVRIILNNSKLKKS